MASSFTDIYGRTYTAEVDATQLAEDLAKSLRDENLTVTKHETADDKSEKADKFVKELPEKIYDAFADDLKDLTDYIKTIADFAEDMKKNAKARGEGKSSATMVDAVVKAINQRSMGLGQSMSDLFTRGMAHSEQELRRISEATMSLAKVFTHRGSGYVHDIHVEAILTQWHKEWRDVQKKSHPDMAFDPQVMSQEFVKAVREQGDVRMPGSRRLEEAVDKIEESLKKTATATTEALSGPSLMGGTVSISSDLLGLNAKEIGEAVADAMNRKGPESSLLHGGTPPPGTLIGGTEAEAAKALAESSEQFVEDAERLTNIYEDLEQALRGQSKLTKNSATLVINQYRTLKAANKVTLEDLEAVKLAMKFRHKIYGIDRQMLDLTIQRLEAEHDIKENAERLLEISKRVYPQLLEMTEFKKSFKQWATYKAGEVLTKGLGGLAAAQDGLTMVQRTLNGIWDEQVKNTTQIRSSLFESLGYTGNMTDELEKIRQSYIDISRSATNVDITGQDTLTTQKNFNKNLRMGIRDYKTLVGLTRTSMNLAYMIGANAEATGDTFARWHQQTGFTTAQMSQLNRQVQFAGKATGVLGDNLLQAVDAARELADIMRDANTLTSDTAGNFIQITASAKKFGTERSVMPILKAMSGSIEYLQNADDITRAFVTNSARMANKREELATGEVWRTQEGRASMVQGMEDYLNTITKRFGVTMDTLDKLNSRDRERLNLFISQATPFKGGIGEASRALQTFKEGVESVDTKLAKLDKQIASNTVGEKERQKLIKQRNELAFEQNFGELTKVAEASKGSGSMGDALAKARMTPEQLKRRLESTIDGLNQSLEKAGLSSMKIDRNQIGGAMGDQQKFANLLEQINDAQAATGVDAKKGADEVLGAVQIGNKINAQISENTGSMAQAINKALGPGGVFSAGVLSNILSTSFGTVLTSNLFQSMIGASLGSALTGSLGSLLGGGAGGGMLGIIAKLGRFIGAAGLAVGVAYVGYQAGKMIGEWAAGKVTEGVWKPMEDAQNKADRAEKGQLTPAELIQAQRSEDYKKAQAVADPAERMAKILEEMKKINKEGIAETQKIGQMSGSQAFSNSVGTYLGFGGGDLAKFQENELARQNRMTALNQAMAEAKADLQKQGKDPVQAMNDFKKKQRGPIQAGTFNSMTAMYGDNAGKTSNNPLDVTFGREGDMVKISGYLGRNTPEAIAFRKKSFPYWQKDAESALGKSLEQVGDLTVEGGRAVMMYRIKNDPAMQKAADALKQDAGAVTAPGGTTGGGAVGIPGGKAAGGVSMGGAGAAGVAGTTVVLSKDSLSPMTDILSDIYSVLEDTFEMTVTKPGEDILFTQATKSQQDLVETMSSMTGLDAVKAMNHKIDLFDKAAQTTVDTMQKVYMPGDMEQIMAKVAEQTVGLYASMPANVNTQTAEPVKVEPVPMGEESTESKIEQEIAAAAPPQNVTVANQYLSEIAANTRVTSEGVRQSNVTLGHILAALSGSGGSSGSENVPLDTATSDMPSSPPNWPRLYFNYNGGARKRYMQVGL